MPYKLNPLTGKHDYYETGSTLHAGTHVTSGGDTIADAVAGGNSGLMSGADKAKLDGFSPGTVTSSYVIAMAIALG